MFRRLLTNWRFWLLALCLLVPLVGKLLQAQPSAQPVYVPVWSYDAAANRWLYTWPALGKTLVIQGGYIEALLPPATTPRVYTVLLTWDAQASGFPLPPRSRNHAVWVNGLRYAPPLDYTVIGDLLKPGTAGNWPAPPQTAVVVCDYDPGS